MLGITLLFSPLLALATSVNTDVASLATPVAVYTRCFSQFAAMRVPANDALLAKVQAGTLTAPQACVQLIQRAQLGSGGEVASRTDPISLAILKTMHDFHRSWFLRTNLQVDVIGGGDLYGLDYTFYDSGEPALYLTRALLGSNIPYSDVVTSTANLRAIRDNMANTGSVVIGGAVNGVFPMQSIPVAATGTLYGVTPTAVPINLGPQNSDIRAQSGGGILGHSAYLVLNSGRNSNSFADGGLTTTRVYSKSVFSDLLCRDIPVIRQSDAVPFVQSASSLPFRKGSTCMQCHASMDNLAYATRNLTQIAIPGASLYEGQNSPTGIMTTTPSLPAETVAPDADPNFYMRPPNGHLYFRSYDGSYISSALTGVPSLGNTLANSSFDDLYVCAAKRYYQFMTGISVSLQDLGDPDATQLSATDLAQRNFVISLGKKLKQDQSLINLISNIISSDAYQKVGTSLGGS